jgi:hypothetical protein
LPSRTDVRHHEQNLLLSLGSCYLCIAENANKCKTKYSADTIVVDRSDMRIVQHWSNSKQDTTL